MMITMFSINRQTAALHRATESEIVNVEDYKDERDAKKVADFKAKQLSKLGYHVHVTAKDDTGKWTFIKKYSAKA